MERKETKERKGEMKIIEKEVKNQLKGMRENCERSEKAGKRL